MIYKVHFHTYEGAFSQSLRQEQDMDSTGQKEGLTSITFEHILTMLFKLFLWTDCKTNTRRKNIKGF